MYVCTGRCIHFKCVTLKHGIGITESKMVSFTMEMCMGVFSENIQFGRHCSLLPVGSVHAQIMKWTGNILSCQLKQVTWIIWSRGKHSVFWRKRIWVFLSVFACVDGVDFWKVMLVLKINSCKRRVSSPDNILCGHAKYHTLIVSKHRGGESPSLHFIAIL